VGFKKPSLFFYYLVNYFEIIVKLAKGS